MNKGSSVSLYGLADFLCLDITLTGRVLCVTYYIENNKRTYIYLTVFND